MWYALKDYAEIGTDNPSLVVAYANLLSRFGHDVDPVVLAKILTQDDPEVDWWSLPEYFAAVKYEEIAQSGPLWPANSNAIVRMVREDGNEAFEHYCLVADPLAHSIIDSMDGRVKRATAYSEVTGWATYARIPDVAFENGGRLNPLNLSGKAYTVLERENIWDVARKTKTSASDILEHNQITDGSLIKSGDVLYIPHKEPVVVEKKIEYEVFDEPHQMHVSAIEGTKKWSFGNAKKWEEVTQTGHTQTYNTNLTVHGIARVPIGEDVAAYYMEGSSLGDYLETGKVKYTIGYSWKDLEAGHVEATEPEPIIHVEDVEEPTPVEAPEPEVIVQTEPEYPNSWKSTYVAFEQPVMCLYNRDVVVQDHDGRRPGKARYRMQDVMIAGEFTKDGTVYGRPAGAVSAGLWFGVPESALVAEEEVHRIPQTVAEKKDLGVELSQAEQVVDFISKYLSKYTHFLDQVRTKLKLNKNKE